MSLTSHSDSSYESRFKNNTNMNWAKNWKVSIWFKRKKKNFRDFRVLDSCPLPKIKNLEISEISFSSNFDNDCNSRFKNASKWTETKTERFRYDLEQKRKFPRFPSFQFCPIPKIENLEIPKISLFLQILTVVVTQDLK